jgi:hypothetical protein
MIDNIPIKERTEIKINSQSFDDIFNSFMCSTSDI